jgi:phosphatidylglycerophosphate synthase
MNIIDSLKNSYTEEKKAVDRRENIFIYYIVRPISYIVTIPFIKLGISANTVSILSSIIALLGSALIAIDDYLLGILGGCFVFLWIVLDCVDGNIARLNKKPSGKGEFLDAMGGYILNATIFMALGSSAYLETDNVAFLYVGYLASISAILPRLLHQKWVNSVSIPNSFSNKGKRGVVIAIIQNIAAVSNLFQPMLIVSLIFKFESELLVAFTMINVSILFYTVFSLVKKKVNA